MDTDHDIFSDEATFHISESVNRPNCRFWGQGHPVTKKNRIAIALGCVRSRIPDMLTRTWEELDYCLNMCRITNGVNYRKHNENKKL